MPIKFFIGCGGRELELVDALCARVAYRGSEIDPIQIGNFWRWFHSACSSSLHSQFRSRDEMRNPLILRLACRASGILSRVAESLSIARVA